MSSIDLAKIERAIEEAVFLSRGTRIQRLKKAPIKLLCLKILEIIALWSDKPIRVKAKTFWNENMQVVVPEKVSLNIYRHGFFEEGLTKIVLKYLKPGKTFVDIGAHFGYFTLLGSYLVGEAGQVHSFEPTPSTFNILKQNVSDKNDVILNNKAVFSQKKIITINDYGIKYSAFNSMYGARLPENILKKLTLNKYEIEAVTIDEYVENKGIRPDFIKIDAESAEYQILIGMEKTIKKYQPIISIEVGDFGVEGVPASKELISYLENKSYKPYEFKDGKILQHVPKNDQYKYDNILFLPN